MISPHPYRGPHNATDEYSTSFIIEADCTPISIPSFLGERKRKFRDKGEKFPPRENVKYPNRQVENNA